MIRLEHVIARGSRGDDVRTWQTFLQKIPDFEHLVIDGIFGSETELCTKAFQRWQALPDDGVVGPKTRAEAVRLGRPRPTAWDRVLDNEFDPSDQRV